MNHTPSSLPVRRFYEIQRFLDNPETGDGLFWLQMLQNSSGLSILALSRLLGLSPRTIHSARERGALSEDTVRLVKLLLVLEHMLNHEVCRAVFGLYAGREAPVASATDTVDGTPPAEDCALRDYVASWGKYD